MTTRAEILRISEGLNLGPGPVSLAVDVGGTGVKAGLVDATGDIIDARTAPTPERTRDVADEVMTVIAALRDDLTHEHGEQTIATVGAVIPGIVDEAAGTGIYSANLGWRDVPFRDLLAGRLATDVALAHDVRAAGRAEFALAEDMPADAVLITIGTGIAGAVRADGRMISAGGFAGELGFTEVSVDTAEGPWRGPIEHIASASSIAQRYSHRSTRPVRGSLEVVEAMRDGDPIAHEIFAEAVDALGALCAQLVAVVAPEAIVLGGGLSSADETLDGVRSALKSRLDFHRMPIIRRAGLGPVAGLIGAGLLTRDSA